MKLNKNIITALAIATCLSSLVSNSLAGWWPANKKPVDSTTTTITALCDTDISPEDTVLVTDIHGVVTRFSWLSALTAAWNMSLANKLHFTKKTIKYFTNNKNPKRAFEGVALEDRPNDANYIAQAVALMNPHVPKTATVEILAELKARGYQVYGCSNIGEKSYAYMQEQYPAAFASIIACRTSTLSNGYLKKNSKSAYEQVMDIMKHNQSKTPTNLLFVDDKAANLTLANQTDARFKGLLFKDAKQLRAQLEQLGMLVTTQSTTK